MCYLISPPLPDLEVFPSLSRVGVTSKTFAGECTLMLAQLWRRAANACEVQYLVVRIEILSREI